MRLCARSNNLFIHLWRLASNHVCDQQVVSACQPRLELNDFIAAAREDPLVCKAIVDSLVGSGPIRDSHIDDNDRKQQKLVHKSLLVRFQFGCRNRCTIVDEEATLVPTMSNRTHLR
jgi:hypothetical protein